MSAVGQVALLAVVALPALGAALTLLGGRGTRSLVPTAAGSALVAGAAVLAATVDAPVAVGDGTAVALGADRVAAVLVVAVLLVGWIALTYLVRAIDDPADRRRSTALAAALLTATVLVATGHGVVALAVGWLGASAALVGLLARPGADDGRGRARRRARRSLLVGDAALVAALAAAVTATGSWSVPGTAADASALAAADVAGLPALEVVALALVVAGVARSALVPLHRWLVPTVAAPTPVSVLLHAGFISGAGVLALRTAPVLTGSTAAAHALFALAVATVVVGTLARRQRVDGKGELAWSTVAQMGFMAVQCAVGALGGALFHIVGHGLYKAARFLGVGDAPAAALAERRQPAVTATAPTGARLALAAAVPLLGLGLGWVVLTPHQPAAATVLVVTFAWAAGAQALWGGLGRTEARPAALAPVLAAGVAVPAAYVVGLAAVERFVAPDLPTVGAGAVGVPVLVATLAGVAAAVAAVRWWPGPAGEDLRTRVAAASLDLAEAGAAAGRRPGRPDRWVPAPGGSPEPARAPLAPDHPRPPVAVPSLATTTPRALEPR